MKHILQRILLVSLFLLISCTDGNKPDYADIYQVSIEYQKGKETYMKYYTNLKSYDFIPTVGQIDSVFLNKKDWGRFMQEISNSKLLSLNVDKGSWGNFPERITLYLSTKKELINLSVMSTNQEKFELFKKLYNFKILGDDKK